jgi:hypothetical protein
MVADQPDVRAERVEFAHGVTAFAMRGSQIELYAIEAYDPDIVGKAMAVLRRTNKDFRFISVVMGEGRVNELNLEMPDELHWWSTELLPPGHSGDNPFAVVSGRLARASRND